jgi:hypothetical protein
VPELGRIAGHLATLRPVLCGPLAQVVGAFRLPGWAPLPRAPPCMRQRRLPLTTGDRHGFPLRVRAWQRGLRCIGKLLCVGSFLGSR